VPLNTDIPTTQCPVLDTTIPSTSITCHSTTQTAIRAQYKPWLLVEVYCKSFLNFGIGMHVNGQGYLATSLPPGTGYRAGWTLQLLWVLQKLNKCVSTAKNQFLMHRPLEPQTHNTQWAIWYYCR
jgi:hypothetical protein